jgi:hypothetical protein
MDTGQMKTAGAGRIANRGPDRHEAISWLVNQIRWERTLDRLRCSDEGRTRQAA